MNGKHECEELLKTLKIFLKVVYEEGNGLNIIAAPRCVRHRVKELKPDDPLSL